MRICLQEGARLRRKVVNGSNAWGVYSQKPLRRFAQSGDIRDRSVEVCEGGEQPCEKPGARLAGGDTAGSAVQQPDTEALLQFSDRLTERRGRHAEMRRRAHEGAMLDNSRQSPELGMIASAHYALESG